MFGFQTMSKILTVWKRDKTEPSEIQTSLDFRLSLYQNLVISKIQNRVGVAEEVGCGNKIG